MNTGMKGVIKTNLVIDSGYSNFGYGGYTDPMGTAYGYANPSTSVSSQQAATGLASYGTNQVMNSARDILYGNSSSSYGSYGYGSTGNGSTGYGSTGYGSTGYYTGASSVPGPENNYGYADDVTVLRPGYTNSFEQSYTDDGLGVILTPQGEPAGSVAYVEGAWYGANDTPSGGTGTVSSSTGAVSSGLAVDASTRGSVDRISNISTDPERTLLDAEKEYAIRQANLGIDCGVENAVNDLTRNEEDAARTFDAQRNRIAIDEANAKDNQALYAQARGDRGGIGAAQYDSIMSAANRNRYLVNEAQTKLATDTQRQIADLRARGEFEKADRLMDVSQSYAKQLMALEMWGEEQNIGIDEFNAKLAQWEQEYNLDISQYLTSAELNREKNAISRENNYSDAALKQAKYLSDLELATAKLTGAFSSGVPTASYNQYYTDLYSDAGQAMIKNGIQPSNDQIAAMGWTTPQYLQYLSDSMYAY